MRSTTIGFLIVLSFSTLLAGAGAWGSVPDRDAEFVATSPNGEFRVVVAYSVHASGQREGGGAGERRVATTLYDVVSGELIWRRERSANAIGDRRAISGATRSPLIWIDDARHVVLQAGGETITVFHPDDGSIVLEFDLLRCFPAEDQDRFIRQTTVGPLWAANARWFYLDVDHSGKAGRDRSYFVVRPWWERHVVIDLDAGEVLRFEGMPPREFMADVETARAREVLDAIDQDDRAWVMENLMLAADGQSVHIWSVPTAAHMAGRLGMEEAIPWLQVFEDADSVAAWSNLWREFTLRQTVQLSLRRLGVLPGDFAATELSDLSAGKPRPIRNAASRAQRVWNIDSVREGMSVRELVRLIGHPDYIAHPRGHVLDYDIDRGGEPFTLRVTLVEVAADHRPDRADHRVASIERITPPIWQDGDQRDVAVTNRRIGPADPGRKTTARGARAASSPQR